MRPGQGPQNPDFGRRELTKPHILLTNDDGMALRAARAAGGVGGFCVGEYCCAVRGAEWGGAIVDVAAADVVHAKRERHWAVEGTPADAVIVALHKLLRSGLTW